MSRYLNPCCINFEQCFFKLVSLWKCDAKVTAVPLKIHGRPNDMIIIQFTPNIRTSHLSTPSRQTWEIINNAEIYTSVNPNLYIAREVSQQLSMVHSWPLLAELPGWVSVKQVKYKRCTGVLLYAALIHQDCKTTSFFHQLLVNSTTNRLIWDFCDGYSGPQSNMVKSSVYFLSLYVHLRCSCILTLSRCAVRTICLGTLSFPTSAETEMANYSKSSSLGKVSSLKVV